MIVEIDFALFRKEEYFNTLDQLFTLFESGQHEWNILNPFKITESDWYKNEVSTKSRLGIRLKNFMKMTVKAVRISQEKLRTRKRIKITITPDAESTTSGIERYSPALAYELLNSNLNIIVENAFSDGTFVKALCKTYKYIELEEAISKSWLDFDQAGGVGEITKRVEAYVQKYRDFKPRIFVFCDSDKKYKYCAIEGNIKNVKEKCEQENIPYHILYKRAIENYLPSEVLNQYVPEDMSGTLQAYLNLNADQKDFYNLKQGFKKKQRKEYRLSNDEKSFFQIDTPQTHPLRDGFETRDFTPYSLFAKKITSQQFKKRCAHQDNPGELKDLLDKIRKLL